MNDERFEVMDRYAPLFEPPEPSFEGFVRRRDRKRRNQRVAAGAVGLAIFVASVWIVTTGGPFDRAQTPGAPGPTGVDQPSETVRGNSPPITTASWYSPDAVSDVDYVIDLNTGQMTPLPASITEAVAPFTNFFTVDRYAATPDGSTLAFVGTDAEGARQIFVAGIDGTDLRQVTDDPMGVRSPAWSLDGSLIAYQGYSPDGSSEIFVLDVATGARTQITDQRGDVFEPVFAPDGRSVLYGDKRALWTVPITGGERTLVVGAGDGLDGAGNGALSPDGSLVTFLGGGEPDWGDGGHCGPCRLVANADGTNKRVIDGWMANPAGVWSPDSTRIVTMEFRGVIVVIDVTTEQATIVANGEAAIWLDDHTLLVAV